MRVTDVLFGRAAFSDLTPEDLDALSQEIPTVAAGKTIIEALVESGVAASNGEARRLIAGGAVSVNDDKVSDDFELHTLCLIKKGKNSFVLVR
ncbi:Tyrosine--tRNA ligase [compost metagenome]